MSKTHGETPILNIDDCARMLADKRNITIKEAKEIFNDSMSVLADAINNGGVSIRHIFTIQKVLRPGRRGVVNGEEFQSKDKYTLHIKTGKRLSETMN